MRFLDMFLAFIFDKDGVLVNTELQKGESWGKTFMLYGLSEGAEWYRARIGTPRTELIVELKKEHPSITFPSNQEMELINQKIYDEIRENNLIPIDSSIEFLRDIPSKYKVGLASSDHRSVIDFQLAELGISNLFQATTSGVDEVSRDKPFPDIYSITAEKLGVAPERCIAIEDTDTGIESAKSAGMYCVGFSNPNSGLQTLALADRVVSDLREIDLYNL